MAPPEGSTSPVTALDTIHDRQFSATALIWAEGGCARWSSKIKCIATMSDGQFRYPGTMYVRSHWKMTAAAIITRTSDEGRRSGDSKKDGQRKPRHTNGYNAKLT